MAENKTKTGPGFVENVWTAVSRVTNNIHNIENTRKMDCNGENGAYENRRHLEAPRVKTKRVVTINDVTKEDIAATVMDSSDDEDLDDEDTLLQCEAELRELYDITDDTIADLQLDVDTYDEHAFREKLK